MAPPSSLPGWDELNDAILDTLWDMLEQYGIKNNFRDKILTTIRQKREENAFPPDYQAQRMVERAGIKYFELLSAVDSDTYNAVQYYASILAKEGLLKAVVTTNFDRNFERSFSRYNIPFRSYFDEHGFNKMMLDTEDDSIPIIKIHGCCSSPGSMIDTRKQRLKGRAKALEKALLLLLKQYHFIFCGFSGQDFDDNKNYLGMQDAASSAEGFTYLYLPGSKVRKSMNELISFYGENKARAVECNPVVYLEEFLKTSGILFKPFTAPKQVNPSIRERLKTKIASVEPLDALNMLTGLAESYGDEISARYIYDKVWKNRFLSDYEGEALSRFLLNHGRSYVFNFQDKKTRAKNAGVEIMQISSDNTPEAYEEIFTNPAKANLKHSKNTSPETAALIGLIQTYLANPILFIDFPKNLVGYFQKKPDLTEMADIYYYYSFYALVHGDLNSIEYLNSAIKEMEDDFDEPRISQLLSRRAMIKLRIKHPDAIASATEDAQRAGTLAEKYHEPHLLALSALALAILARVKQDYDNAFKHIAVAEKYYADLRRIPQYIESIVEYLKIILLSFEIDSYDKQALFNIVLSIKNNVENYIVEQINVFEPEYCYLMGMILYHYSDLSKDQVLAWFADSVSLAEQFRQAENYNYFRETCRQLNILEEIDQMISKAKNDTAGNQ